MNIHCFSVCKLFWCFTDGYQGILSCPKNSFGRFDLHVLTNIGFPDTRRSLLAADARTLPLHSVCLIPSIKLLPGELSLRDVCNAYDQGGNPWPRLKEKDCIHNQQIIWRLLTANFRFLALPKCHPAVDSLLCTFVFAAFGTSSLATQPAIHKVL